MRSPTFVRLNVDEIAAMPPNSAETFRAGLRAHEALLIEDDRRAAAGSIPSDWMEHADKVVIAGRTLKNRNGAIDPTERRGLGSAG